MAKFTSEQIAEIFRTDYPKANYWTTGAEGCIFIEIKEADLAIYFSEVYKPEYVKLERHWARIGAVPRNKFFFYQDRVNMPTCIISDLNNDRITYYAQEFLHHSKYRPSSYPGTICCDYDDGIELVRFILEKTYPHKYCEVCDKELPISNDSDKCWACEHGI